MVHSYWSKSFVLNLKDNRTKNNAFHILNITKTIRLSCIIRRRKFYLCSKGVYYSYWVDIVIIKIVDIFLILITKIIIINVVISSNKPSLATYQSINPILTLTLTFIQNIQYISINNLSTMFFIMYQRCQINEYQIEIMFGLVLSEDQLRVQISS